jgi:hypothetical protein
MRLIQIVRIAHEGYTNDFPESGLLDFVNRRSGKPLSPVPPGDLLAAHVVHELHAAFEGLRKASDEEQLDAAVVAIEKSAADLDNVLDWLKKAAWDARTARFDAAVAQYEAARRGESSAELNRKENHATGDSSH